MGLRGVRRPRRRWLASVALLPLLFLTFGPSANADFTSPAPWPGLPPVTVPTGSGAALAPWQGTQGNGLTEVSRARQWVKIPAQAVAAGSITPPTVYFPADDPLERQYTTGFLADISLSSPAGATSGYGIGLPVTVRTVAFGAVPVQVGMRLEQLRSANDLPVPLRADFPQTLYRQPQQVRPGFSSTVSHDFTLTGRVRVRLTSLAVDGVDVGLGDCLSAPIDLELHSTRYWNGDVLNDPFIHDSGSGDFDPANPPSFVAGSTESANWMAARGQAHPAYGGAVTGEVDIPAFAHCLARSGEDLSPLLTSAVSGPGNSVTVGISTVSGVPGTNNAPCGTLLPGTTRIGARGPFRGDPSDCNPGFQPPTFDYPARTD